LHPQSEVLDNGFNAKFAGYVSSPGVAEKAIVDSATGSNCRPD
jgi:hypothetical protein